MEIEFDGADFNEIDFDIELENFSDIEIDFESDFDTRIIKPPLTKALKANNLKYSKAEDLAKHIVSGKGFRYYSIINGTFIFGDFIEALVVNNNWHVKKMTISTLSMSQNNVDSLANLINGKYVDELNLIVSDHFFSHERHSLIKYIYKTLDIENIFQLAVCRTHCKTCIIETHCGLKIVMHGSANLRSSGNIEQFCIEENEELFDFNDEYQDSIIEEFKTINKSLSGQKLWQAVQKDTKK